MNLPSLTESVELIYSCIKSSTTQPQLATCKEMVDQFIAKRYKHYEDEMVLHDHVGEMMGFINDRDKEIAYEAGIKASYGNVA